MSGATINCVLVPMMLLGAAAIAANSTIVKVKVDDDKTHAICSRKCSQIFKNIERPTHETCMLKCRNYIEETMFRPRSLEEPTDSYPGARHSRAAGPRDHMFVRVGKSFESQADSDEDLISSDQDNDGQATKRRVGGFVRIGRGSTAAEEFEENMEEKRANKPKGQAFVRIGRKAANFVRIGKAFVRIGKNSDKQAEDDDDNAMTSFDE